jgi:hypothetical protein
LKGTALKFPNKIGLNVPSNKAQGQMFGVLDYMYTCHRRYFSHG